MLKKYRYHIDYIIKKYIFSWVFLICWDWFLNNELVIAGNSIMAIMFTLMFSVYDLINASEALNDSSFNIKSLSDLSEVNPAIKINANDIVSILNKIKNSKRFGSVKFTVAENGKLILSRNLLIRKLKDVYNYNINDKTGKVEIKTILSKSNISHDMRKILDLSEIKKTMTA